MDVSQLLTLTGLALVDSTSFGTLGIPLVLVVASKRVERRPLGIYFGTVVLSYFLIGLGLLFGLTSVIDVVGASLESRPVYWGQLIVGVGLFALSFRFDGKRSAAKPKRSFVPKVMSTRAIVALALTATLIEVASMVPYLGAIGLLSTSNLNMFPRVAILAAYCTVMVLPAFLVIAAASLFGDRMWTRLERLSGWMQHHSEGAIGWIMGIAGFFLAADAYGRLFS